MSDSMNITMDWSPAETHPGDPNHLKSGNSKEAGDVGEERGRSLQRKEQCNAKRSRDDKKTDRRRLHNVDDVHAMQHKKASPTSVSKPTAKRSRDNEEDDITSKSKQDSPADQRASKRKCGNSAKDRRILSSAFFELVERGGGEIRYDVKEDPWGLSKRRNVAKSSWEMSTKRFDDEMFMLGTAMVGTSLKQ
ncbi:hypothetical protein ACHAQE_004081 [Botrytis cinerea]